MDWLYLRLITLAHAQEPVQLLEDIPGIGNSTPCIENYIRAGFNVFLAVASVIAIIQFAFGGFMYMMSEAVTSKEDAKKRMTSAVWGILLILASYIILYQINPDILTTNIFGPCPSQPGPVVPRT